MELVAILFHGAPRAQFSRNARSRSGVCHPAYLRGGGDVFLEAASRLPRQRADSGKMWSVRCPRFEALVEVSCRKAPYTWLCMEKLIHKGSVVPFTMARVTAYDSDRDVPRGRWRRRASKISHEEGKYK